MSDIAVAHSCQHVAYRMKCHEYDALLTSQGRACAICDAADVRLVIDHDHDFGYPAVRGVICQPCNTRLRYVDAGTREPTARERRYLATAWHLEKRPNLAPLVRPEYPAHEHDKDGRCPEPVGPDEIALMLNVSRQRVTQLRQAADFPRPWRTLAAGSVWRDTDIEDYARTKGRDVRPSRG